MGISQGGADYNISLANLLDGQTIDQGSAAAPASDTDTFWTGQGGSTMLRQTLAAVWSWVAGHLPSYKLPVAEISVNTTLDGSSHNGRLLICSSPVTLAPSGTMGSGFNCNVINISSGNVTLGAGITTSSADQTLTPGQSATIFVASYSGGTLTYAMVAGGMSTPPAAPGTPTGLAAGTPTSSVVPLSWTAPGTGGAVSSYTVQYRVTGTGTWTQVTGITGTSTGVTGLVASTGYDFQVQAVNAGGSSGFTGTVNATTANASAPGLPTGLTAGTATSSSVPLSWTAPARGGAVSSYTVHYRATGAGTWPQVAGIQAPATR